MEAPGAPFDVCHVDLLHRLEPFPPRGADLPFWEGVTGDGHLGYAAGQDLDRPFGDTGEDFVAVSVEDSPFSDEAPVGLGHGPADGDIAVFGAEVKLDAVIPWGGEFFPVGVEEGDG